MTAAHRRAALEMILQAQFVVIDALVRPLDAGIGKMLVAIAEVILAFFAETHAGADVVAELEAATELALRIERGRRQEMQADRGFDIRCDGRTRGLLDPEDRRKADIQYGGMGS